ncbi:hypothetical protein [Cellulomonas sp. PhB143]|uniref:DUF7937 domain-containing protein n=1 Tax=Cellulomonas sp. PhB143 TaxID=2485186 RepID=UPI000FA70723|nr:hypothetical protein [Cellulomonas sp. PhB143]ROS73671.1 hypothetical protein EDF32_2526 [Cellulomonas sp. PhB143]
MSEQDETHENRDGREARDGREDGGAVGRTTAVGTPAGEPLAEEAAGAPRPFADVPAADYVRDGAAALLLLCSLSLPWTAVARASDRAEVVLVTLLSLLSLALPYLARTGLLPGGWTVRATRATRLLANAPYGVAVVWAVVADLVAGDDGRGLGSAAALGLAGALLAAQPRACELAPADDDARALRGWRLGLGVIGVVAAVATVVALGVLVTDGPDALVLVRAALAALFVLVIVCRPILGALRGDDTWRIVVVGLGAVLAATFVLGSGNATLLQVGSVRFAGFALLLLPAAGAVAGSALLERAARAAGVPAASETEAAPAEGSGPEVAVVLRWVAVARHALMLLAVTAAFVAADGLVDLVDGGPRTATAVLSLVLGLLVLVATLPGVRALGSDAVEGRAPALAAAGASVVVGIVLLVAGGQDAGPVVGTERWLLALGLPALVVLALTGTGTVRAYFAAHPAARAGRTGAYVWAPRRTADDGAATDGGEKGAAKKAAKTERAAAKAAEKERAAAEKERAAARDAATSAPSLAPAAAAGPEPDGSETDSNDAAGPEADGSEPDGTEVDSTDAAGPAPVAARAAEATGAETTQERPRRRISSSGSRVPGRRGPATVLGESTQVIPVEPERTGYAARPGLQSAGPEAERERTQRVPVQGGGRDGESAAETTSALPPVRPETGPGTVVGRWTTAQAADPGTSLEDLAAMAAEEPALHPYIAANPATYPALLDWLGGLGEPEVDAALAARR